MRPLIVPSDEKKNNNIEVQMRPFTTVECHKTKSLAKCTKIVIKTKGPRIRLMVCTFLCKMLRKGVDLRGRFRAQWS